MNNDDDYEKFMDNILYVSINLIIFTVTPSLKYDLLHLVNFHIINTKYSKNKNKIIIFIKNIALVHRFHFSTESRIFIWLLLSG